MGGMGCDAGLRHFLFLQGSQEFALDVSAGALLWIAYGISIHARPVIVSNVIVATAAVYSSFRKPGETGAAP